MCGFNDRGSGGGFRSGGRDRPQGNFGPREMHPAKCSEC